MHTQEQCVKKQIIFHSVSTMLSITSPSKAGALLKPHRCPASHSHQELCIRSYSIHHIPAKRRHVDAGLGKSCSQCQCPGRPDGQLQIYPKPFFTAMSAVCAAWAEAGIDTIHHECKLAT